MKERKIIEQLLAPLADNAFSLQLTDDAAIFPSNSQRMVVTTDMLVAGIHFLADGAPADIACKALATNLSDLAAMGANPYGFQLALGLTSQEEETWLTQFCEGLRFMMTTYAIPLTGGDIVRGCPALTLSITAFGLCDSPVLRSTANVGDKLAVTGTLGDAALGLQFLTGNLFLPEAEKRHVIARYWRPTPRLQEASLLQGKATAMMDISDGLLTDVQKLCNASGVGTIIELDNIPLSHAGIYAKTHHYQQWLQCISAGDDYELLYTIPNEQVTTDTFHNNVNAGFTIIGEITTDIGVVVLDNKGNPLDIPHKGYEH